jgi:hypothetical protein
MTTIAAIELTRLPLATLEHGSSGMACSLPVGPGLGSVLDATTRSRFRPS